MIDQQGCNFFLFMLSAISIQDVDYDRFESFLDEDSIFLPSESGSLSDLAAKIASAIENLGGSVLPKYIGTSPKDAIWISSEKSLRCATADEVFLLLKASDRISRARASCKLEDRRLDLIGWIPWLSSSFEFRVFYFSPGIPIITQRDCSAVYANLVNNVSQVFSFLLQNLSGRQSFTGYVDVYADFERNVFFEIQQHLMEDCVDFYLVDPNGSHTESALLLCKDDSQCRLSVSLQNMYPTDTCVRDFFTPGA